MSDKDETPKSRPNSGAETNQNKPTASHSIKKATNLLKAEALRRLQLPDAEYDGDKESPSDQPDVSTNAGEKPELEVQDTGKSDGLVQNEDIDNSRSKPDAIKNLDEDDNVGSVAGVVTKVGEKGSSKSDHPAENYSGVSPVTDKDNGILGDTKLKTTDDITGSDRADLSTYGGGADTLQGDRPLSASKVESEGEKLKGDKTYLETQSTDPVTGKSAGEKVIQGDKADLPTQSTDPMTDKSAREKLIEGDKTDLPTQSTDPMTGKSAGEKVIQGEKYMQSTDPVTGKSAVSTETLKNENVTDKRPSTVSEEEKKHGKKGMVKEPGDLDKSSPSEKLSESLSKEGSKSAMIQSGEFSKNTRGTVASNEVSPPFNVLDHSDHTKGISTKDSESDDKAKEGTSVENAVTSEEAAAVTTEYGEAQPTDVTVMQDQVVSEYPSETQAVTQGESITENPKSDDHDNQTSEETEPGEKSVAESEDTRGKAAHETPEESSNKLQGKQESSTSADIEKQGEEKPEETSRETAKGDESSTREPTNVGLEGKEGDGDQKKTEEAKDEQKVEEVLDKNAENVSVSAQDSEKIAGDENQQETEAGAAGEEEDDEEGFLPDDFYYSFDDLVSKPYATEGIPQQLITLHHSFGFECTKRSNLHVIDENTVLFSAGNSVEILDLQTQKQTHVQSTSGGGIGALAVHPSRKYFAVAEKGNMPNINIYEYPSLKLYRVLREGTEKAYAHLDFNPKGDKLASVGSAPDFMLTVWNWKKEKIILRSKAFSQDVHQVAFAAENEGHLCSTGLGHIRFWTMANTFTGLKLQGEIGKFGTKELSDIEGFVEMPDGKVLSGCEWGNMLLWDGGLIKVEICKKGRKPCHNGMIQQFFMDEGELITIGIDGYVKVWDFESIDSADTTEEGMLFEMDPMYELKVGTDVKLMSMVKASSGESPIWFAQDAGGGIWKLDLSFTHTSHAPSKLFSYHAGAITGLATSPVAHFVATTGIDNTVRIYDYVAKSSMCQAKYNSGGSSLLWLPRLVDAKGSKILAGFSDGVVRLLNLTKMDPTQSRSKKQKSNFELSLGQVFKPHTKPVTTMVVDEQGEILATGSEDCTVFFFTVGETYKPIGFVETASPVVSLVWSRKGKKEKTLLVSCRDGAVLEVEAPEPGNYDTSKSYYLPLSNLKITEFQFSSIKEKLRQAEEDARKAKEEEEKRKKKEEERLKRRARGLEEEEEEEEEEEDKGEEKEEEEKKEEEKEERLPPQAITAFYHGNKETFWLSMDGWDAGYLYECQFKSDDKPASPSPPEEDVPGEPIRALPVDNSDDVPIRAFCFSHSKKFFLLGMDDGTLRIHPLENEGELNHLSNFWSFNIHDNQHGSITNLTTSFDDKFVLSVGADGNFFIFKFMDAAVKGLKVPHRVSIPSAKRLLGEEGEEVQKKIDDIDDPNFYSIEMEKQKAEHDRMMKLAEEKKQRVRQAIAKLRRNFKQLLSRNQELPPHAQLLTQEFEIDPEIRRQQEAKTEEKIELVRKEMAWDAEKHTIGLRKLQKRFKDEIECERIVLRAFQTTHKVSSFRASKTEYLKQLIREADENASRGGDGADGMSVKKGFGLKSAGMKRRLTQEKLAMQQQAQQQQQQQQAPPAQSQLGGKVAKALEKAEARKKKRLARQAQWDELYRNKPDENYQDPKDVAAIKEARENMGDYKLKTAKDYVVPESQRVNADKKRVQLLNLLEQINHYKFDFNQKFIALREKKIRIIKEIKDAVVSLEKLQTRLDPFSKRTIPEVPEMKPDECPERRLEYTREKLLEFKKEMEEKVSQSHHDDGGGGGFGGFGGFGGGAGGGENKLGPPASSKPGTQQKDRSVSSLSLHSPSRPRSSLSGTTGKDTPEIIEQEEKLTPLEQQIQYEEQIRLQYDQDVILDKIKNLLDDFDAELRTLRHEKLHLEVALKSADLRQVTLFEEYMLLKEFEKRENIFANKVDTKLDEKEEMIEKVEDCQIKLEQKKQDIEKLQEQEKALYATFTSSLGENNKFENFLTRVFKKKIKRAKKKAQTDAGSDEDSEEDDSDDDFTSSDEDDSDADELDDSVCPPGCDQSLFDQVCQLREKRLDLEELLAEEKKTSETLKKEYDALVKKAKVIDSALKTAEADLEAFQREKQQKLNELDVVVVLRLHQVQHVVNGFIAQDLSPCLVFKGKEMIRLQQRIKELEKEKGEQKRLYREHRQMHVQLIRDKKGMEAKIEELEGKVKDMQMLKFGRLVDLAKLETVSVNRTVEELKEKLRQEELNSAREIAKWDNTIDSYKEKVTQLTRENTQRLDTYTVLLQEKKELEQMLDSRQKSLGTEFSGARKADLRERQRLVQLVQLQAQEIDALKDEITLLSRKGGHILPPAQPPLPPGHTPIPNQS